MQQLPARIDIRVRQKSDQNGLFERVKTPNHGFGRGVVCARSDGVARLSDHLAKHGQKKLAQKHRELFAWHIGGFLFVGRDCWLDLELHRSVPPSDGGQAAAMFAAWGPKERFDAGLLQALWCVLSISCVCVLVVVGGFGFGFLITCLRCFVVGWFLCVGVKTCACTAGLLF